MQETERRYGVQLSKGAFNLILGDAKAGETLIRQPSVQAATEAAAQVTLHWTAKWFTVMSFGKPFTEPTNRCDDWLVSRLSFKSLNRYAFRQVPRFVNIKTLHCGDMVGEELKGQNRQEWR